MMKCTGRGSHIGPDADVRRVKSARRDRTRGPPTQTKRSHNSPAGCGLRAQPARTVDIEMECI
eukprot:6004905-Prymnesium_polylepis.2